MRLELERKLNFDDVVIRPKRSAMSSRSDVNLTRVYNTLSGNRIEGIPIIAANMDTVGTPEVAGALSQYGMFTALHKYVPMEDARGLLTKYTFQTFGMDRDILPWFGTENICLDVANGYTETFVEMVKRIRDTYRNVTIMAGNVATPDMTEALILAGADIVKVGIGPGSACETTLVTGIGYPQLSAIIECADAAHGLRGLICADGGCRTTGDIVKAFAAGADFVMLGGMLAGHQENSETLDGVVRYYGMSSTEAMTKYAGGVAPYRASEGKVVTIPFRGPISNTIQGILGGLRSACTYVGAAKLKELPKRTTFVRVK